MERKESVRLPCSCLAWLEKRVLECSFGDEVIAFAGGVLLCGNSSQ